MTQLDADAAVDVASGEPKTEVQQERRTADLARLSRGYPYFAVKP